MLWFSEKETLPKKVSSYYLNNFVNFIVTVIKNYVAINATLSFGAVSSDKDIFLIF